MPLNHELGEYSPENDARLDQWTNEARYRAAGPSNRTQPALSGQGGVAWTVGFSGVCRHNQIRDKCISCHEMSTSDSTVWAHTTPRHSGNLQMPISEPLGRSVDLPRSSGDVGSVGNHQVNHLKLRAFLEMARLSFLQGDEQEAVEMLGKHLSGVCRRGRSICSGCGQVCTEKEPTLTCASCGVGFCRTCGVEHQKKSRNSGDITSHYSLCPLIRRWRNVEQNIETPQNCRQELVRFLESVTACQNTEFGGAQEPASLRKTALSFALSNSSGSSLLPSGEKLRRLLREERGGRGGVEFVTTDVGGGGGERRIIMGGSSTSLTKRGAGIMRATSPSNPPPPMGNSASPMASLL